MRSKKSKPGQLKDKDATIVLKALFEILEAATKAFNLETLYPAIQLPLGQLFNQHQVYLVLYDPDHERFDISYCQETHNPAKGRVNKEEAVILSKTVVSRNRLCLFGEKDIKAIVSTSGQPDIPFSKAWLGVPLVSFGRTNGVMAVACRNRENAFDAEAVTLLKMIAQHFETTMARKESNDSMIEQSEILNRILESSPVGIALVQNRVFKWVNRKMVEMFGYSTKQELENQNARMLYQNQKDYERAGKMIFYGLTSLGSADYEINMVKKDQSLIPVHIRLNSADPSDPMNWTIASISDISQRRAAEKNRVEKEKLKGVLAIAESVCHEIDQPLNQIMAFFTRQEKKQIPDHTDVRQLRKHALKIGDITKRLTDITQFNVSDTEKIPKMPGIWGAKKQKE